MATTEQVRDIPQTDYYPADPNVTVPKHVRDAAEAAEAIYKQAYPTETAPEPVAEAPAPTPDAPTPTPDAPAPHQDYSQPATPAEVQGDDWAARYNSMYGRWTASQRQVGEMQQQMTDLAAELQRTQSLLTQTAPQEQPQQTSHKQLITDQDREQYGDDLIDVARRAAMEAVSPEIEQLRAANQDLKKQVTTTAQRELKQHLRVRIPNWTAINSSPEFKRWLSLPNIYTGEGRGRMLSAAYAAANAPQVIALFSDFINEVKATGGELPGIARQEQQAPAGVAPRQAAIQLETLAAPGRARPASGDSNLPADKPTYTRQQIANFYADVRRNAYSGRETEKHRIEQDIYVAQREGRVRA